MTESTAAVTLSRWFWSTGRSPTRRAETASSSACRQPGWRSAELLRHAGTPFDPEVTAAFQAELADPSRAIPHAAVFDGRLLSVSAT